ncbi:endogenous retrovirus group K member 25 Pol protein-like protein [Turdus rufiventris]|nr:endogenous retrovirus group K member 25 Pol protein-like protein [Turdus rufiventris]
MSRPGVSVSMEVIMLEEALYSRKGIISIININSYDPVKAFYQIGNDKADVTTKGLWTLEKPVSCMSPFTSELKHLQKTCRILTTDAKHVIATCPHCQKSPLWASGINPRGLKASEIWQTDFTLCQLLRPRAWLAVTVDTYSGVIVATQHLKTDSKATIQHWLTAMAWLGVPKQIKTDNGPNFVSKSVQDWIIGRPHNSYAPLPKERETIKQPGTAQKARTIKIKATMVSLCDLVFRVLLAEDRQIEDITLTSPSVLIVPRVLYRQEEEVYRSFEEPNRIHRREAITGITITMLLGLGGTGAVTDVSALAIQHQGLSQLQTTIDEDSQRIEKSISFLEKSISSLSEVVLQNRRGLDLLFMQQGGLCAA